MTAKRILQSVVIVAVLAASFASAGNVFAWSGCSGYITVQWGDTLSGLAAACGTTVEAIRAANPGLGWWLYAGQGLYMPTGYTPSAPYYPPQTGSSTYVVQWGDSLGGIAMMMGVSLSDMLAVNPQIGNASLIYPGQVLNLPAFASGSSCNYYGSTYCPTTATISITYPATATTASSGFSPLRVTYGHGLLVRTGPGTGFSEIKSPFVSAVKNSRWIYRRNSVTVDSIGFVWVEVMLDQMVNGSSTGWIMVKDSLGNYFTLPNIDQ